MSAEKIVIVGSGASAEQWLQMQLAPKEENSLHNAEVWTINFMGLVMKCDKIVGMDYIPPNWNEDRLNDLIELGIPIISCKEVEGVNVELYPLKEVIASFGGFSYFNTSVAYAIALAIYRGAKVIGLYGIDFTWPTEAGKVEYGRGCVEFWLGVAVSRGIGIIIPKTSTLMDVNRSGYLYGYSELEELENKENKNG